MTTKRCENHKSRPATHQVYVKDCGKSSDSGCDFEKGTPGHKRTRHYSSLVCRECAQYERASGFGTVCLKA